MSPSRPRENVIETYLVNEATSRGWLCYKTSSPGTNGFPDRTIVTDTGFIVFCEVKRPHEKPRKLQVRILRDLVRHGANACVVDTCERIDALMSCLDCDIMAPVEDDDTFYVSL